MVISLNPRTQFRRGSTPPPGRTARIGFVVLVHLGLVYLLASAMHVAAPTLPPPPISVVTVDPVAPAPPDRVEPRDPVLKAGSNPDIKDIVLPPLQFTPDAPPTTVQQPSEQVAVAILPALHVAPRIDQSHSVRPPYPALARRLEEEGTVILRVVVGIHGDVLDVAVEQSSGHPALDKAAVAGVRTGYRFVPGTDGGVPAEMIQRVSVSFKLTDQD